MQVASDCSHRDRIAFSHVVELKIPFIFCFIKLQWHLSLRHSLHRQINGKFDDTIQLRFTANGKKTQRLL